VHVGYVYVSLLLKSFPELNLERLFYFFPASLQVANVECNVEIYL